MASGSEGYAGINAGKAARAGKGKKSAAKERGVRRRETTAEAKARRAATGDFF